MNHAVANIVGGNIAVIHKVVGEPLKQLTKQREVKYLIIRMRSVKY